MASQGFKSRLVRVFGFIRRETTGILHQPRLIVTLIIAPFAILLIFGLGYRTEPPPFQTLLVLPTEEAGLATEDEFMGDAFGDSIDLVGTTTDAAAARSRLRRGDVDLLVIAPPDALESLDEGERAEFLIVHSEVDPVVRASVSLLARLSVEELNRLILQELVSEVQAEATQHEETVEILRTESGVLVEALEERDPEAEREARAALREGLDRLEADTAPSNRLRSAISSALGTGQSDVFETLRSGLDATEDSQEAVERASEFQQQVETVAEQVERLRDVDPALLVSPFGATVNDIADVPSNSALSYAPGVLIVLVQHLAITFAALSLVRERELGLPELFRVSPLAPVEILAGKFISFLAMSAVVAAALAGALYAFGVPVRGNPLDFVVHLLLVIVASIGLGFTVSSASQTNGQAVQYTMMILLVSIFFTGMVLPLDQLIPPVRVISYLLPATYGIQALQDIMFRGLRPSLLLLAGISAYALITLVVSWFVMRRHVKVAS